MSIFYISENDFELQDTIQGKVLSLTDKTEGLNLVLFYSSDCSFCNDLFKSGFKELPLEFSFKFSICNMNVNRKIIHLSKDTISPIEFVPEIFIYLNGYPVLKYEGENEIGELKKFIIEACEKLSQSFTSTTSTITNFNDTKEEKLQLREEKEEDINKKSEESTNQCNFTYLRAKNNKKCFLNVSLST